MSPNLAYKQISNQLIEAVREHSDLVSLVSEYLSLKKTGQNYTGLCPFHQERTPSFSVNPLKQFFHCFGCGAGGDVFHFLEKIEGLNFSEALGRLAERGGIPLPSPERGPERSESDEIYRLNEAAASFFHKNLLEGSKGACARSYLKGRGVTIDAIREFSIGYALPDWDHFFKMGRKRFPVDLIEKSGLVSRRKEERTEGSGCYDRFRNRIVFPIHTMQGRVVGFGGRVLDESLPKYLNTPETAVFTKGKQLYGLHKVKRTGGDPLIVVEGYLDVVSASQFGIPNVVATLGTALTEDHIRLIRRVGEAVVLVFDGDKAGIRAALRAIPLLLDQPLSATIVSLPAGKDPDTFLREEGHLAFLDKIQKGKSLVEFSIDQMILRFPENAISAKMKVIEAVLPLIEKLSSPVKKGHFLKTLSESLELREEDVRAEALRLSRKAPGGSLKGRAVTPVKKNRRIPEEQETILKFLVQDLLEPEALNGKLNLKDFTDPLIQGLISQYWDGEASRWFHSSLSLKEINDEEKVILSRLSVDLVERDQVAQAIRDCIRKLRTNSLNRKKNKLDKELKQLEKKGDLEEEERVNREIIKIIDLKRAVSA